MSTHVPPNKEAIYFDPTGAPVKQSFRPSIRAHDNSPATAVNRKWGPVSQKEYDELAKGYADLPRDFQAVFKDQAERAFYSINSDAMPEIDKLTPQRREEYLILARTKNLDPSPPAVLIIRDIEAGGIDRKTAVYFVGSKHLTASEMDSPAEVAYAIGKGAFCHKDGGQFSRNEELHRLAKDGNLEAITRFIVARSGIETELGYTHVAPEVAQQSALQLLKIYSPESYKIEVSKLAEAQLQAAGDGGRSPLHKLRQAHDSAKPSSDPSSGVSGEPVTNGGGFKRVPKRAVASSLGM